MSPKQYIPEVKESLDELLKKKMNREKKPEDDTASSGKAIEREEEAELKEEIETESKPKKKTPIKDMKIPKEVDEEPDYDETEDDEDMEQYQPSQPRIPHPQMVEVPTQKREYSSFKEDEVLSPEEAQARISLILAESKNLHFMTELRDDEIKLLAGLKAIAEEYGASFLDKFIQNFLEMRISLGRKGRTEIKDVARGVGSGEEKMRKGLKSMILGLR